MDKQQKDTQESLDERTEILMQGSPQRQKSTDGKPSITSEDNKFKDKLKKKITEYKHFGSGAVDLLACRFDPEDSMIATGGGDGMVHIYSLGSTDKPLHILNGAETFGMPVTCLRWRPHTGISKTKHVLVTGCSDGNISHWHVSSGKLLYRTIEKDNQVLCLDYNSDGSQFATAGKDKTIRVYDESTKSLLSELAGGVWQYPGHSNRIFALKYVPNDPNIIVTAGWDNTCYFWDLREGKSFASIYGPSVSGDALDIKGNTILTGSWRNKEQLELWDFGSRKRVSVVNWEYGYNVENAYVYGCQFSKKDDDSILAGCSNLNEVRIFDRKQDNRNFGKINDINKGVYSVDYANNMDLFAFCGGDGFVHVVQIAKTLTGDKDK